MDSPKKSKTFESNDARVKDTPQHLPSVNNSNQKVTIIGDSIIKQIKANKLRKNLSGKEKVFVKSFPGATVSHMHHYVKPSMEFDPNLVIIHVGTNELRSANDPNQIANGIINLATGVKRENNEVILSSIITRADKFKDKADAVNKHLKQLCNQNSLEFIDNSNILQGSHISHDGLHLNFKGTLALSNNFCRAISY